MSDWYRTVLARLHVERDFFVCKLVSASQSEVASHGHSLAKLLDRPGARFWTALLMARGDHAEERLRAEDWPE